LGLPDRQDEAQIVVPQLCEHVLGGDEFCVIVGNISPLGDRCGWRPKHGRTR
jgi:hypothetical protein